MQEKIGIIFQRALLFRRVLAKVEAASLGVNRPSALGWTLTNGFVLGLCLEIMAKEDCWKPVYGLKIFAMIFWTLSHQHEDSSFLGAFTASPNWCCITFYLVIGVRSPWPKPWISTCREGCLLCCFKIQGMISNFDRGSGFRALQCCCLSLAQSLYLRRTRVWSINFAFFFSFIFLSADACSSFLPELP